MELCYFHSAAEERQANAAQGASKQIEFLLLVGLVSSTDADAPPLVMSLCYALPAPGSGTMYESLH